MANTRIYYEQFLFAAALDYAVKQGFYFGEDCEHDFRLLLRKAVNRLFEDNLISKDEELEKARLLTAELVQQMILVIKSENKLKRLREHSLKMALKKLCPCYPFC